MNVEERDDAPPTKHVRFSFNPYKRVKTDHVIDLDQDASMPRIPNVEDEPLSIPEPSKLASEPMHEPADNAKSSNSRPNVSDAPKTPADSPESEP